MDDYQFSFSILINNLTDEERDWMDKELAPPEDSTHCVTHCFYWDPEGEWPGFEEEFFVKDNDHKVMFHSKNGNLDNLVTFLVFFMKKFRPNHHLGFDMASVCRLSALLHDSSKS